MLPLLVRIEAGIEKVPVEPLFVMFEVRLVPVFAPLRLYVATYVLFDRLVEVTVTTEEAPIHTEVAAGEERLDMLG